MGSPSRKWIATFVSSRNATVRGLHVVTLFDRRRTWQRLQTRNHLGDGGCGRIKGHHISRPNDDEFDAFPEGGILGEPDGSELPLLNVRAFSKKAFSFALTWRNIAQSNPPSPPLPGVSVVRLGGKRLDRSKHCGRLPPTESG